MENRLKVLEKVDHYRGLLLSVTETQNINVHILCVNSEMPGVLINFVFHFKVYFPETKVASQGII